MQQTSASVLRRRRAVEEMPNMQAFKTTPETALDREISGSAEDVKPTAVERDIARRLGVDPVKLARTRAAREARQTGRQAEQSGKGGAEENPRRLTEEEHRICEKMNIKPEAFLRFRQTQRGQATPEALAQNEVDKLTPYQRDKFKAMKLDPLKFYLWKRDPLKYPMPKGAGDDNVPDGWDGYINRGGPGDRSYQLTALDREACLKLGVDPQQFLAWKRDPISAPRPKGLPADPHDAFRGG
jgi:hypothetical protein